MSIYKIKKRENPYVTMDVSFLRNPALSAKAKGLLAYLLSLPPDWKVNIKELVAHFTDGKHAISEGIKELKKAGYIVYEQSKQSNGRFDESEYAVYETPQPENQVTVENEQKSPQPDFPVTDNPAPENQALLNIEYTNNRFNKENKAAAERLALPENEKNNKKLAAAFLSSEEDFLIGHELTNNQKEAIVETAKELSLLSKQQNPQCDLACNIETSILNPDEFKKSGHDFLKKLNTIKKAHKESIWVPGAVKKMDIQKQQELDAKKMLSELNMKINEERGHLQQILIFMSQAEQSGNKQHKDFFQKDQQKREAKIALLKQRIVEVRNGNFCAMGLDK